MTYKTSLGRVILALICGALVGGNLSVALLVLGFGPPEDGQFFLFWQYAQIYWLGGVAVFGAIPFILFHMANLRQWHPLTASGVLTMVSLCFVAFKGLQTAAGITVMAILGAIVGWVIWRVAYRRLAPVEDEQ